MLKKLVALFIGLGLVFSGAYAGEYCKITGDVTFRYDGDIYICLNDKEGWRDFQTPGQELSQLKCKVIKMNADLKKAGKVSFAFDNVTKGTYCLLAYQDTNENGKIDFENYMINEPWAASKELEPGTAVTWDTVRFDLEEDIADIKIQM